jgi:hypothetical protein
MASDTGAPWLLPYPEDTDLVRDGASDIEALAVATAAGLSAADNAGIGSNVVSVTKTNTFTTTSTSQVDITGLATTITPTSNTAKVLVICNISTANDAGGGNQFILVRGSTNIALNTETTNKFTVFSSLGLASTNSSTVQSFSFLDSPLTAAATTYKVTMSVTSGTGVINRQGTATARGGVSTITAIEVAA